jgi:hypothetical protein
MYKIKAHLLKAHLLYNVSQDGTWLTRKTESSRVRPTRTPDWTGVMFAASAIVFYLNLQQDNAPAPHAIML